MPDGPLEKVTTFITRDTPRYREILVFEYPMGMIQIPAGTVEIGESIADAAMREATEETGLSSLTLVSYLGNQVQQMKPDHRVVLRRVVVRQQPAPDAPPAIPTFAYHGLRRGLYVRQVGTVENGFVPIAYEEFDGPAELADTPSRCLSGWVEEDSIHSAILRHFFHLTPVGETPDQWVQNAEEWGLPFDLFWLPITGAQSAAERLRSWQAAWFSDFRNHLLPEQTRAEARK